MNVNYYLSSVSVQEKKKKKVNMLVCQSSKYICPSCFQHNVGKAHAFAFFIMLLLLAVTVALTCNS